MTSPARPRSTPRRERPPARRSRGRARLRGRAPLLLALAVAGGALLQLGFGGHPATAGQQGASSARGRELYLQNCAGCHGQQGQGSARGPGLVGAGAASADFYLSTGRMPLADPEQAPKRQKPAFDRPQIDDLVAYVASLDGGPAVPRVDPAAGHLAEGERLYQDNCAACHSATGTGGALTSGQVAPSLLEATPVQMAEAVRVGPGAMPKFDPDALDDQQVDSVTAYVGELQRGGDAGGARLGRVGPVAEGLVAWVVGLGLLVLVVRRLGKEAA
jgi:ubiquinol-cytochrome c reductase cytochrome c subunit